MLLNKSELRDMRSEGTRFKNKHKFMILKITLMPQTKEAFVGSNVRKYKIYITISIGVLFWCLIYRNNIFKNLAFLFVLTLLISDFKFVFFHYWYLFILIFRRSFFRIMSENSCSRKNMLLIFKHIWRKNWITSEHETTVR